MAMRPSCQSWKCQPDPNLLLCGVARCVGLEFHSMKSLSLLQRCPGAVQSLLTEASFPGGGLVGPWGESQTAPCWTVSPSSPLLL